jgi:hypothetical protein
LEHHTYRYRWAMSAGWNDGGILASWMIWIMPYLDMHTVLLTLARLQRLR